MYRKFETETASGLPLPNPGPPGLDGQGPLGNAEKYVVRVKRLELLHV